MRHLTEGELQSWIDAEMDDASRALAQEHLAACETCWAALRELQSAGERLSSAMHTYDEELAALGGGAGRSAARVARRGTFGLGRAAAIVLLAAAGAAAVVPGGPLRSLWDDPSDTVVVNDELSPAIEAETPRAGTSITVHPVDGRLTVDVTGFPTGTVLIVESAGSGSAVASLPAWAENARFIVSSGRLRIAAGADLAETRPVEADPIRVRWPESLREGVLTVDGVAVARVDDGELVSAGEGSRGHGDGVTVILGG